MEIKPVEEFVRDLENMTRLELYEKILKQKIKLVEKDQQILLQNEEITDVCRELGQVKKDLQKAVEGGKK